MILQKLYIAIVVSLSMIAIFGGLVYVTLVVVGPAPSISYVISHSEFYSISIVFLMTILSVIQMILCKDSRRAHFLLPKWMKDSVNQYYAENPKNKSDYRRDNTYIIITVVVTQLVCLLVVALTLKNEVGEHIF